jgi:hypothetical protein
VLAEWGYRLGHDDDTLLPMTLCQLFLLNSSPHIENLGTEVFDRIRHDGLLSGARLNTVHAAARAVNALGFCDPPPATTDRGTARAIGGAQIWQQWVDRWYATSTLTPRARGNVEVTSAQSRPLDRSRASRCRRSGCVDAADVCGLGRRG